MSQTSNGPSGAPTQTGDVDRTSGPAGLSSSEPGAKRHLALRRLSHAFSWGGVAEVTLDPRDIRRGEVAHVLVEWDGPMPRRRGEMAEWEQWWIGVQQGLVNESGIGMVHVGQQTVLIHPGRPPEILSTCDLEDWECRHGLLLPKLSGARS